MIRDRHPALPNFDRLKPSATRMISFCVSCLAAVPALAQPTNFAAAPLTAPSLPEASLSLFRIFGALALVIGLFLGGAWLFRNWRRLAQRGRLPQLNILETRSLGGRHAIHVIGYQQERFLIASSAGGVNLLSHLPVAVVADGETEAVAETKTSAPPSFAQALSHVLKG